jgi:MFS family permease
VSSVAVEAPRGARAPGHRYKWIALSNTTLGVLMVTINQSILLISLPDIFNGIKLNPLTASNTSYFLWVFMGFTLVTAVLVVSLGRVGDMYGRVRMYNLGFAVFTLFSVLLSVTWMTGSAGALWIIIMRVFQGVGGAFLFANSSAILTDAFPPDERGKAMGINGIAAVSGSFLGLVLGGLLGPVEWHLVFLVSVPFGLFGTVWAYVMLHDNGVRVPAKIDWLGNAAFAVGLVAVLTGIVYSLLPYGGHPTGWTNPWVLAAIFGGLAVLALFVYIETRVPQPMFRLNLFKIRAFTAGNLAGLLGAMGRGGLQFILIIWLQGIWLPQHGYSFSQTPLWAGIAMLPLTAGFLLMGPLSGILSDRLGARGLATGGLVISGATFLLLELLPMNFSYIWFAVLVFLFAVGMGMFFSPNQAAVMNSLPPDQRGAGAGMLNTFQNSATVLSMGLFFTIITLGLAAHLPSHMFHGLTAQGVAPKAARVVANEPPIGSLFSAFLGYNPIKELLGPIGALRHLSGAQVGYLTGRSFFPKLIEGPFGSGLHLAFDFAAGATLVAVLASALRGGRYIDDAPAIGEAVRRAGAGSAVPALEGALSSAVDDGAGTAGAGGGPGAAGGSGGVVGVGAPGTHGAPGADGEDCVAGTDGKGGASGGGQGAVAAGADGKRGAPGADGEDCVAGADGKRGASGGGQGAVAAGAGRPPASDRAARRHLASSSGDGASATSEGAPAKSSAGVAPPRDATGTEVAGRPHRRQGPWDRRREPSERPIT